MERWFVIPLNPEGWAIGPLSIIRKSGKLAPIVGRNQQLHEYKEAVRKEFKDRYGSLIPMDSDVELRIYIWQRLDEYQTASGRRSRDKAEDLTNIVKATEDAIQGVLIHNDNRVRAQRNVIVDRDPAIEGALVIYIADWKGLDPNEIPDSIWEEFHAAIAEQAMTSSVPTMLTTKDIPF